MKRLLLGLVLIFSFILAPIVARPAAAIDLFNNSDNTGVCGTNSTAQDSSLCKDSTAESTSKKDVAFGPDGIVALGLNIFSIFVGLFAVIVIIISGLRLVLAGGDSNSISSARRALLYSMVGLATAALAQAIVKLLLSRL